MAQATINAEIHEAYHQLKTQLTQSKGRITTEEPPKHISVAQGSLWGTSAKTAQKAITYTLQENPQGTIITSKSTLTKAYVNFTLFGVVFSVVLLAVCIWIAADLQTGTNGFWGWLANSNGYADPDRASLFVRLCWVLAAFLTITLAAEGIILVNVRRNIEEWAKETLNFLKK